MLSLVTRATDNPKGLLDRLIEELSPLLSADRNPADRLRALWGFAKAARDLGEQARLAATFFDEARKHGLVRALGRQGDGDVRHVIDWALRGLNPFQQGPLQ